MGSEEPVIRIRRISPSMARPLIIGSFPDDDPSTVWEPNARYWGAFDGEGLVAAAGVIPSKSFSDVVFLCNAAVLEPARGKGLQKRLIRARCAWARRNGYVFARTYTVTSNPASACSLIACGFKPFWPRYKWAGDSVIYWMKDLIK